jgi:hypothetical protein
MGDLRRFREHLKFEKGVGVLTTYDLGSGIGGSERAVSLACSLCSGVNILR